MSAFLGIDLGGTKVAAGVVFEDGGVHGRLQQATAALRASGDVLGALVEMAGAAVRAAGLTPAEIAGAGLALPGPADRAEARLLCAPTLPELENVPLAPRLGDLLGLPVVGDNDANAAALGEARFGAGRDAAVLAYFTVSTGIGGGIVIGGRLFHGASGAAAEFGHQRVEPDGEPCACGADGCLETVASGPAIARRARRMLPSFPRSLLADREWRAGREWDAALVAEAGRAGDALALHLWEEVGEALGLAVANVVNVLDPDVVVLGGGVMQAAELLVPSLRQAAAEHSMPALERPVAIVPAGLGPDTGVVGAAALAMQAAVDADDRSAAG